MKKLITFGCSWTWGVGANWHPSSSVTTDEHRSTCMDEDTNLKHSFRSKLCDLYNLDNENYAKGRSSNQRNFRIAREIFSNKERLEALKKEKLIVLWGITSTSRTEIFVDDKNEWLDIKFGDGRVYPLGHEKYEEMFARAYSHEHEVRQLAEQMVIWNDFFNLHNIPVIWFDTFNTHNYHLSIDNLVKGDLLTTIVDTRVEPKKAYHLSSWINDDNRVTDGVKQGLLNPHSFHPSQIGHDEIVKILSPYVEEKL